MQHPIRLAALAILVLAAAALAACAPQETQAPVPTPTRAGTLVPFQSATPSATPTPFDRTTPTPLPSPTATMRSHVITRGQDLGGIAYTYRVSLQALLEANPEVDPYFLVVGSTLNIPASAETVEGTPMPTPVALQLGPVHCSIERDGGAWCFVLATNPQEQDVESVSAIIRVADEKTSAVFSQVAIAPLDLLPAGGSLPLAAYFPPPMPKEPLVASAELLTSLPVFAESQRYLPLEVQEVDVEIQETRVEAEVSGVVVVGEPHPDEVQVRVAAVAYDAEGNVVGLRRWESSAQGSSAGRQVFTIWVYSTGGEIERVEVLAEAR